MSNFITLLVFLLLLSPQLQAAEQESRKDLNSPQALLQKVMPEKLSQVVVGKSTKAEIVKWFGTSPYSENQNLFYNLSGIDYDLHFSFNAKDQVSYYSFEPSPRAQLRSMTLPILVSAADETNKQKIKSQATLPGSCMQKSKECNLIKIQIPAIAQTLYFSNGTDHRLKAITGGKL